MTKRLISLHGGHSGEFCQHAENSLAEIIDAYESRGFSWAGITEHMPPVNDRFLDPDQQSAGLTAQDLNGRFERYITLCRSLQKSRASRLRILVGVETEAYDGAISFARTLIEKYEPDVVVGSVHHVDNINFDFDPAHYQKAVQTLGGIDRLYHRYFDTQHEMIAVLRPRVVGHFDLVRLFDSDYRARLSRPDIAKKIERNLSAVKESGLALDLNMRALQKGAREPYPSRPILQKALAMNIPVVPGDDSHGVNTVGAHIEEAIDLLKKMGFNTRWEEILEKLEIDPWTRNKIAFPTA